MSITQNQNVPEFQRGVRSIDNVPEIQNTDDYIDDDYIDDCVSDVASEGVTEDDIRAIQEERYQDGLVDLDPRYVDCPYAINLHSNNFLNGKESICSIHTEKMTVETVVFPTRSTKGLERDAALIAKYEQLKAEDERIARDALKVSKIEMAKISTKRYLAKRKVEEMVSKKKVETVKAEDIKLATARKDAKERRKTETDAREKAALKRIEEFAKTTHVIVEQAPVVPKELSEEEKFEQEEIALAITKIKMIPLDAPILRKEEKPVPKPLPKQEAWTVVKKDVTLKAEVKALESAKAIAVAIVGSAIKDKKIQQITAVTIKTQLCRSVTDDHGRLLPRSERKKCFHKVCNFAHGLSELKIVDCRFKERCNKPSCCGRHPAESKETWTARLCK